MSKTLEQIVYLVARGEVRVSEHGYDELINDGILARDLVEGIHEARLVEDYPDYGKGPCVLVLQAIPDGTVVHAVWGIPKGKSTPAVLVTAYRPASDRWAEDFMRRR